MRLFLKSNQGVVREITKGDSIGIGDKIQFKVKSSKASVFYGAVISKSRQILMNSMDLKSNAIILKPLQEFLPDISFELDDKPAGESLSLLFCTGSPIDSSRKNAKLIRESFQKDKIDSILPNCERLEWRLR